jgi:hypothetical protein
MVLAADQSAYAFDAMKDNLGMVAMAIVVIVTWVLFRRMLELSERKKKNEPPPKP